jgi:hypothetical protein
MITGLSAMKGLRLGRRAPRTELPGRRLEGVLGAAEDLGTVVVRRELHLGYARTFSRISSARSASSVSQVSYSPPGPSLHQVVRLENGADLEDELGVGVGTSSSAIAP